MKEVRRLQGLVKKGIEDLDLKRQPQTLYEPVSYTLQLGGKRLRPVLVLLTAEMTGGRAEDALAPALGVELFHNFTLLHDDIMDAAPLRRGKLTVYQQYNTDTAILAGDVMMVRAQQLLMQVDDAILRPVLELFNQSAIEVCEGQQFDLNFETSVHVSISDYLEMIRLKTAVLLGTSMAIGALASGREPTPARSFGDVGEKLGMAFQLQDDILDSFGNPQKIGKQAGGDIIQNKKTYLLLKAMELATPAVQKELEKWLGPEEYKAEEKVKAVKDLFEQTGAYDAAVRLRDNYYQEAIEALHKLDVRPEPKSVFLRLAQSLLNREH